MQSNCTSGRADFFLNSAKCFGPYYIGRICRMQGLRGMFGWVEGGCCPHHKMKGSPPRTCRLAILPTASTIVALHVPTASGRKTGPLLIYVFTFPLGFLSFFFFSPTTNYNMLSWQHCLGKIIKFNVMQVVICVFLPDSSVET